jgi:hypothetical protein
MAAERQTLLANRALGVAALVCRGHIETASSDPKAREMYDLVLEWLLHTGAWEGLDAVEGVLLVSPPGTLTRAETARAIFSAEKLAVLAWGCGVAPAPLYDEHPHDRALASRLGFLRPDARTKLERGAPRDPDEVVSKARAILAVEDRLRRFALDGRPIDFANEYGLVSVKLVGGDLGFDGLPLAATDERRWQLALAAAVERASAARWLVAPAPQRVAASPVYGDA